MEEHRCSVCLTQPSVQPATVKACGHEFCLECLRQWCRTRRQPKCPLCQGGIQHIVHDGTQEDAPLPDRLEEEGPDLGCLDHFFFAAESDRLLCRARAAQMELVRSAYGCGRQGSSSTDRATDALQQVIDMLVGYREAMQHEVPFQPEEALYELHRLDQAVQQIASGGWAAGGGGTLEQAPSARFSADDAAAGFHEWQDHLNDDEDSEDYDGQDSRLWQRLERASLDSTLGRRPTPGRRCSSGDLAGGGGGGGRRR